MKTKLLAISIIGGFILLFVVFALGLRKDPTLLNSAVIGKPIVAFSLPDLLSDKKYTNADLTTNKPYYLVNFWGSWCPTCYQEMKFIDKLAKTETIYGINWKDQKSDAKGFLMQMGNPFKAIIVDNDSLLAIGMGVYGAPETFLVRKDGIILHRYPGELNEEVWQSEFVPLIKKL